MTPDQIRTAARMSEPWTRIFGDDGEEATQEEYREIDRQRKLQKFYAEVQHQGEFWSDLHSGGYPFRTHSAMREWMRDNGWPEWV